MTALADVRVAQTARDTYREPGSPRSGPMAISDAVRPADRSGTVRDHAKTMRSWPLLVLAVPAAAEVWSGWVGIAQKTGFGMVPLLPGIWSSLHLDTAVTLPVGVECYAAYALRAWLATGHAISDRTRRFARWSAICSFALGMAGQVAFHLMDQDRDHPGTLGHHHPRVLPSGPGPGHGDRPGPHAARGRRSSRARTGQRPRTSHSRAAGLVPGRPIRGPARPEPAGPDRQGTPPSVPDQDAAPA